jgi:hypothetical protein
MKRWLNLLTPLVIVFGALVFGASIGAGGCAPPATCAGTELGLGAAVIELFTEPSSAFFGIFMILFLLLFGSQLLGMILIALLIALVVWLIKAALAFRRA